MTFLIQCLHFIAGEPADMEDDIGFFWVGIFMMAYGAIVAITVVIIVLLLLATLLVAMLSTAAFYSIYHRSISKGLKLLLKMLFSFLGCSTGFLASYLLPDAFIQHRPLFLPAVVAFTILGGWTGYWLARWTIQLVQFTYGWVHNRFRGK